MSDTILVLLENKLIFLPIVSDGVNSQARAVGVFYLKALLRLRQPLVAKDRTQFNDVIFGCKLAETNGAISELRFKRYR